MRTFHVLAVIGLAAVIFGGCQRYWANPDGSDAGTGGDSGTNNPGDPLTMKDVVGLPEGDVTWAGNWGLLVLDSWNVTSCECRVGNVAGICGKDGSLVASALFFDGSGWVNQEGAWLGLDVGEAASYDGGLYEDGTFILGGVLPVMDTLEGAYVGEAYELMTGSVSYELDGSTASIYDVSFSVQARWQSGDTDTVPPFDCDLSLTGTLSPAAF